MSAPLEGERRWTTVFFTDMVNFTAVSEKIGAEKVYTLLSKVIGLASECIEKHGGHMVDYAGDSVLAAFGAPIALENASLHACMAASDFLGLLDNKAEEFEREFGIRPQFRIGISGGTIILGHLGLNKKLDVTVMGEAVNLAARLEALAEPGEILIGDTVFQQVEGYVSATDIGEKELKGFSTTHRVFRLDEIHSRTSRFEGQIRRGLVSLVGREHELETLLSAVNEPKAGLQIITISATAGIGKSRLIHEFCERVSNNSTVLVGQCHPSTRQIAFSPFSEIVRSKSGFSRDARPDEITKQLRLLLPDDAEINHLRTVFADTVQTNTQDKNVDEQGNAMRIRRQMVEILVGIGKERANILIIEDAHWIDGLSAELIEQLVSKFANENILLIITHRPEFTADWTNKKFCTAINLQPLNAIESRLLTKKHLDIPNLSPDLIEIITDKAEGNPLFAEEIIRYLKSGNKLQVTSNGLGLADKDKTEFLSGNLQHLIMSRIDALPEKMRDVLQIAATIGRQFSTLILERILNDEDLISTTSQFCVSEGLIELDPTGLDKDWRFTHALINDAIYGSLLSSQQIAIHEKIARIIEENIGNQSNNLAETLAYHYSRANIANKAVVYLAKAANKSIKLYAIEQARNQLERAFSFIEEDQSCVDDDLYGKMLVIWLRSFEIGGGFDQLLEVAERLLPRLQSASYSENLSIATTLIAISKTHTRDYPDALKIAMEMLAQTEAHDDVTGAAWAKIALMRIYEETCWEGQEVIERLAEEIKPVAKSNNDHHMGMLVLYLLSSCYRSRGQVLKAKEIAGQIREFALKHDDRRAMSYSCWALAVIHAVEDKTELALKVAEQGLETALPGSADATVNWACWVNAQVLSGEPELAREKVHELIVTATRLGDYNIIHTMEWTRAIMEIKAGHLALGWKILHDVVPQVDQAGNLTLAKHAHLIRGEILLIIAGLIDPAQEGENKGKDIPKPKLGFRDIITGIRLRFSAKKMAAADFEFYCNNEPNRSGAGYARAQIGLGIIAKSKGQKEPATGYLVLGRDLARDENLDHLVSRAERFLAA